MPNGKRIRAQRTKGRVVRKATNANSTRMSGVHARLSKPATDYARAMVNPFDGPICACPDLPVLPTRKERYWIKGSASTGSNGSGYVMFSPFDCMVNDLPAIYTSSSTSTENGAFPANDGATGLIKTGRSNSPYASSVLTGGNFGMKVVSGGVRIRYTGQVLTRSGIYLALQEPSHESVMGKSSGDCLAYPEAKKVSILDHKDWFGCTYVPADIGDTKFINKYATSTLIPPTKAFSADATEVYYDAWPFMGVIMQTAAGSAVTFDYEACVTVEIIGKNVTGKTPSHADPIGLAAVHSAIASHPHTTIHHGVNAENHAVSAALGHVGTIASTIGQGLHGLAGATTSVANIIQSGSKPTQVAGSGTGKSGWDVLHEIWNGVSAFAPLIAGLLA